MADESVKVLPDIPQALAVVPKDREQVAALARRIGGEKPPNEAHLHCAMCGWSGTISFTPEELDALGGDPETYTGPCPGFEKDSNGRTKLDDNGQPVPCGCETLQPMRLFAGDQFRAINDMAADARRREAREQGEVMGDVIGEKMVEKAKEAFADMVLGSVGPVDPGSDPKP